MYSKLNKNKHYFYKIYSKKKVLFMYNGTEFAELVNDNLWIC